MRMECTRKGMRQDREDVQWVVAQRDRDGTRTGKIFSRDCYCQHMQSLKACHCNAKLCIIVCDDCIMYLTQKIREGLLTGDLGARRRLFIDASRPSRVSLNASEDDGNDHVTFDHIATLCHTDIMTLDESHDHRCDDEVQRGNMRPSEGEDGGGVAENDSARFR